MNNLKFEYIYSGHYRVTYTTPRRGDYYVALVRDMGLIDATKNADEPTRKDIEALKAFVRYYGSHYSKKSVRIDE